MRSKQPLRLAGRGLIDRSRPLGFRFDGDSYTGFAGDTLASALLSAGVRLMGRSFKYHRPRGVMTAGSEEPNALVEMRTGARREANTRATVAELFEGLEARSQNRWPTLRFDLGALSSALAPVLVAGFYYKTFMWPKAFWERLYEPAIRRAAGLGRASDAADPDEYEKIHAFCDVLVVGGGPAGLSATLTAGRSGARVILCDEDFLLGGRLNCDRREIDEKSGCEWAREMVAELESLPEVTILRRTTVFGAYDGSSPVRYPAGGRTFGAIERVADHKQEPAAHEPRQRLWQIVAKRTILAAGALERPVVFGGNDRPGVMLASAMRTYVNRFGVAPGRRIAVFTATDDGWTTAFDLLEAGVEVEAVIDARDRPPAHVVEWSKKTRTRTLLAGRILATHGARELSAVTIRAQGGTELRLSVDALGVAGGWNPNVALSTHLGGRPRWSESIAAFVPGETPPGMSVVGAARGSLTLSEALSEGSSAAVDACQQLGFTAHSEGLRASEESAELSAVWFIADSAGKAFVDLQHDVTADDVAVAVREGFRAVEHLKRYTTLGMGTDQAKTSGINGHAIAAALTERSLGELGTIAARPPYTPVAVGALAGTHRGHHFKPTRLTPAHAWAAERGASFVETGEWLRAQWFANPGERDWLETVTREVKAVRSKVGVCDVSTLGKIDVQGTDAATFLDRVYINVFSTLPVGKVRYGVMLREDGFVMDDGTTARLGPDHYLMSTTTANAGRVMQHLEYARQVLWPDLDVQLSSVSEQWAQYALAGPRSRCVLEQLLGDTLAVSNEAFPYMACAEFAWAGMSARLFRISFSGELAYELAVPARHGDPVIREILGIGAAEEITPYGLEALSVMRIEKGHVAGGELNGTTTAGDLGFAGMMSTKKDFIGRTLARRPGLTDPARAVLVGIRPLDPHARLRAGAHLLSKDAAATLENDQGYVTSCAFSPLSSQWIGLALLSRGRERLGEHIRAHDPLRDGDVEVEVVAPVFHDREGARLRA